MRREKGLEKRAEKKSEKIKKIKQKTVRSNENKTFTIEIKVTIKKKNLNEEFTNRY